MENEKNLLDDFDVDPVQSDFGDDDDVIEVNPEPAEEKKYQKEETKPAKSQEGENLPAVKSELDSELDYEKAKESLGKLSGVVVGEIGMRVARVPIERYKATTQKIDRIGIVSKQVLAVKTHYIEDVGSILCFEGKCCEVSGMPNVRYLFPTVIYSTDNEGNIVGKKLDLKILSASEDLYKSIITINSASKGVGGIDQIDLYVTCTDDKYQKITLNQAGPAAWRKSKNAVKFVTEKWRKDSEHAYMAVARKIDEDSLMKLIGLDGAGGPQVFDDSNTDLNEFFNDN